MFRKISLAASIFCVVFFATSPLAEAHVLKEDNGYSAVMHIDPDDEPLANEPTVLNFYMDNTKGDFLQTNYQITATVSANDQPPVRLPVDPQTFGNPSTGLASITFPKPAVYTVLLQGINKQTKATSFQMSYLVRVSPAVTGKGTDLQVVILSVASLIILAMIAAATIAQGGRYKPKTLKTAPIGRK